jgi:exopolysaccharide biosynthesis polyprenyl glycosylphosphotransferase
MISQEQGLRSIHDSYTTIPIPAESVAEKQAVSRPAVAPRLFQRLITMAEIGADFFTSVIGVFCSYYTYYLLGVGKHQFYSFRDVALFSAILGLVVVLLFERDSAYRGSTSLLQIRETERSLRVPCFALLLLSPLGFLLGGTFSRGALLSLVLTLPVLLIFQKYLIHRAVEILHSRGYGVKKVLIYGAGYTGRRIYSALLHSPKLGFETIGITDDDPDLDGTVLRELGYSHARSAIVHHKAITAEYLTSVACDTLFIAIPGASREAIFAAMQAASIANVQTAFIPDRRHMNALGAESIDLDGVLLTFTGDRTPSLHYRLIKRVFDYIVALIAVLLLSPIFLLIAVLIKLDSSGPVLFLQERVGLNGKRFTIFKFRSMHVNAPTYAKSPLVPNDNRITRVGRLIRKTSLDELPQLLNVLRGDMSLVGPRPEMPFLVDNYSSVQRQRLQVIPGITGLWQLSADRAFLIHESPEYDLYYMRNCGFFLDLSILLHTVLFAMRGV